MDLERFLPSNTFDYFAFNPSSHHFYPTSPLHGGGSVHVVSSQGLGLWPWCMTRTVSGGLVLKNYFESDQSNPNVACVERTKALKPT